METALTVSNLKTSFHSLQTEKEQTQVFCKLAEDLNLRIKAVLAERAKDRTNEWRRFVRQAQVRAIILRGWVHTCGKVVFDTHNPVVYPWKITCITIHHERPG